MSYFLKDWILEYQEISDLSIIFDYLNQCPRAFNKSSLPLSTPASVRSVMGLPSAKNRERIFRFYSVHRFGLVKIERHRFTRRKKVGLLGLPHIFLLRGTRERRIRILGPERSSSWGKRNLFEVCMAQGAHGLTFFRRVGSEGTDLDSMIS